MKRSRLTAALVMMPVALAIGAWFYLFFRRTAIYWGMQETTASVFAVFVALCGLAAFLIKPIPIKGSAVFAAYLLLFSLLSEAVLRPAGLLSPVFSKLCESGLLPPVLSAFAMLYAAIHGRKTVLTRYQIWDERVLSPLRIALLSDVHMGLSVDEQRLQTAIDTLLAQKPDLLILAGDLVDDQTTPEQMENACRIIGAVKPPHGVWFVYGNHDVAAVGPGLAFSSQAYRDALERNGISILDDQVVRLEGIALLAGRLDAWGNRVAPRLELEELLRGADRKLPIVLIDHQPQDMEAAAKAGILLQLSGHTHGGQIWPAGILTKLLRPRNPVYGHRCQGNYHIIVSAGLGTRGTRMRSGCTAETVLVDLLPGII